MNKRAFVTVIALVAAAGVIWYLAARRASPTANLDAFAQCLAAKNITMYGAAWCPHCQNEKKAFGSSFKFVPYVECPEDPKACIDAGIAGYPTWVLPDGRKLEGEQGLKKLSEESGCALPAPVSTFGGVQLPVSWGDLGVQMANAGVVDEEKLEALYASRPYLKEETARLLVPVGSVLTMTPENAPVLLNLLWAFGLGNKNEVLEKGPMTDPRYDGAGGFASTGGWTLAHGGAMDHYSRHSFVTLTPEQQELVRRVAENIYRPCCNNATYFPDCNHGMAMLGLLELMAAQGTDEAAMYQTALQVNALWFPNNYRVIAQFLDSRGIVWDKADARSVLGAEFSSASGYQQVLSQVQPDRNTGGSSCGV